MSLWGAEDAQQTVSQEAVNAALVPDQNFAWGASSAPHWGQTASSFPPHSEQNFACVGFSCWHTGQCTGYPPQPLVGARYLCPVDRHGIFVLGQSIGAAVIGLLICLLLQYLRIRLTWWPFHPLAFAVTSSWQINLVWSPLLLAWVLKTLILRYGGRQGYARSLPFVFGLMLGQFTLGGILFIIGAITHIPTYSFAP